MTRTQFDARFAATPHTTSGYTEAQLAEINDEVFMHVADVDADRDDVHQFVKSAFDAAHAAR